MKYIKKFESKGNEELNSDINHMLLPVSDDLFVQVSIDDTETIKISIDGNIGNQLYKVFSVDDYIDEIERVIDYLKKLGYIPDYYIMYEVYNNLKIISILSDPINHHRMAYFDSEFFHLKIKKNVVGIVLIFKLKNF